VISTHIETIEQSAGLKSLTRWVAGLAPELRARPVLPPLLLVTRPCPFDPPQRPKHPGGHWSIMMMSLYADICTHQAHKLDYMQGQGRLMRRMMATFFYFSDFFRLFSKT
jgi:hypothetical protein